jgi:hypothetical protein
MIYNIVPRDAVRKSQRVTFGKSQEREGGFDAEFLEILNACTAFLVIKATRNYKTRCTHVSLKASQACQHPTQHSLFLKSSILVAVLLAHGQKNQR